MPGPHSCFVAASALRFELADSERILEEPVPVVSQIVDLGQFGRKTGLTERLSAISIGDQLLEVNGMPFKEVFLICWRKQFNSNSFILSSM
jgi:hypothetical protein